MIKINKYLILIYTISFASFMVNLDTYVVNVALPSIAKTFDSATTDVSWIIMSYNLMVVSLLLIFGKLGDIIGLKKLFNIGFVIFTVSSFFCGISGSIIMLILSRFFQGIGASILYALPQAMIAKYLPKEHRGMAFGVLASAAALGITLGAPVSGIITEILSWRWVFFINIPVGILSVYFLNYSIQNKLFEKKKTEHFDFLGALLSFIFSLTLTLYINRGNSLGWSSKEMLLSILISLIALTLFVIRANKIDSPLLNLNIFKDKNFDFANIAMFLTSAYLSATNFLIPFYLINIAKFSNIKTGFAFMIYSVSYLIASIISGKISNKLSLKLVCVSSMLIMSINIILFVFSIKYGVNLYLIPFFTISGITMSFFITSNNNIVMKMAKSGEEGMVAGTHRMTGRLGMLFGVAFIEALYTINLIYGSLYAFIICYICCSLLCFASSIFSAFVKKQDFPIF